MGDRDNELTRTRLQTWLAARLPDVQDVRLAPLRFPVGVGNSAETIFVDASFTKDGIRKQESYVMRLEVEGHALFLDATLDQPWNMMKAMARHKSVPVPALIGFERDRSLLGAPFFLMKRDEGRAVAQSPNYNVSGWVADLPPQDRRTVWTNGIKMMAELHKIDWRDGFEFLLEPARGKAGLEQSLHWTQEWFEWTLKGRSNPIVEEAMQQLRERAPKDAPVQVLWGDPGTHNLLFRDDLSVSSVIDWEIGALGPGESDLAWWLFFDDFYSQGMGIRRAEGFPSREETIAVYEAAAGRKVEHMDYYSLLAELRMTLVGIRSYDRYVSEGRFGEHPEAMTHTPFTRLLAERMKLPLPEISPAFFAMIKAVNRD